MFFYFLPAFGKSNADDEWEHSVVEEKWFALSAWNVWVVALYKHQKKFRWNIKHWASVAALTSVRHPPYVFATCEAFANRFCICTKTIFALKLVLQIN